MKHLNKLISGCITLMLILISFNTEAQFIGPAQAQSFFPAAGGPFPIPTSTVSRPSWPTFYNQRNNGSCHNTEIDLNGDFIPENIYVWAINWEDVAEYSTAVAYEIKNSTNDSILYRGTHYVGADMANLNVGVYRANGGAVHLAVAYWSAASTPMGGIGIIKLDDFALSLSTGLSLASSTDLYYMQNGTGEAQHIGMDCHGDTAIAVVWEDVGYGVFIEGLELPSGGSGLVRSFPQPVGNPGGRIPDVALSHNTSTGIREAHVVFNNVTFPRMEKYTIDFDSLVLGYWPTPVLEDTEPCNIFGPYWDDFIVKIDAPDHQTGIHSDWAYTFFDDDNNKIKVKVCNGGIYNSYVVNNGTIPVGGGSPLWDITNAGSAFPTITYHPSGDAMYIGWYTNYNLMLAPGVPNNQLYEYTGNTMGYVSVILDETGTLRTNAYNRVDNDYNTNKIGKFIDPTNPWTDYNYPKLCFSKHNDGPFLFSLFSSHNTKSNIVFYPSCPSASLQSTYHEAKGFSPWSCTPTLILCDTNYDLYDMPMGFNPVPTTTVYLSQKYSDWYTLAPVFRTIKGESIVAKEKVRVASNPFSAKDIFQLKGGEENVVYRAVLNSLDGKRLLEYSGKIAELNKNFNDPGIRNLPAGIYQLELSSNTAVQNFKLMKQ